GSTPGRPMQTSHTFELGGSPSCPMAQPQNILVRVRGCTWTSIPMTTSHAAPPRSAGRSGPARGSRVGTFGLPNAGDLGLHTARHLIRARHAQGHVLSP